MILMRKLKTIKTIAALITAILIIKVGVNLIKSNFINIDDFKIDINDSLTDKAEAKNKLQKDNDRRSYVSIMKVVTNTQQQSK